MKDFWKRKRNKRIAASALAVVMAGFLVWGLFPWQASAAKNTVADDVTINKWHDPLSLDDSTKNVGRIWTDKSVSTENVKLTNKNKPEESVNIEKQAESDFLVGLSALSSTAEIMGQTTVPLDIVLVLDVSGSMNDESGGYQEVYQLDTSKTYYILRSGKYTKVKYSDFLGSWYYGIWPGKQVTPKTSADDIDSNHDQFYKYKRVKKMTTLKNAVNSFIDRSAEENGKLPDTLKSRISIVKFAGDKTDKIGNDTYKDIYNNTQNFTQTVSEYKAYTNKDKKELEELKGKVNALNPAGTTAADYAMQHAKTLVEQSKNNASRKNVKRIVIFFTDGEPTHESEFNDKVANDAITSAKEIIKSGADIYTIGVFKDADASITGHTGGGSWSAKEKFNAYMHGMSSNYPAAETYKKLGTRAKNSSGEETQYYKAATDAADLNSIFTEIRDEIISSAQSPTQVEQGEKPHQSGYITFTDQLGDYMQVDDMNALVYANKIYKYKDKYKEKQESSDKITYIYEGQITHTDHVYEGGNLNYIEITVQKSKNLQTGDLVTVKIPANMIPLRYYKVSKDKMTISETYPMRLFYDVSLKADAEKKIENPDTAMQEYIKANTNGDGQVQFYSNKYEAGSEEDGKPETIGADSHFIPATTNDFYYFQENTSLYIDENCTKPATSINPAGEKTYYYQRDYYEMQANGTAVSKKNTVPIPGNSDILLGDHTGKNQEGEYYIKAGTPRTTSLSDFTEDKAKNKTGTAFTFIKPTWETNSQGNNVTVYLGNNGKMTYDLPGELNITKTVTAAEGHTVPDNLENQEFTYTLNLKAKDGKTPQKKYTAQYTGTAAEGGEFTIKSGDPFKLKNGQTLKIYGLESGTTYDVTETKAAHFTGAAAGDNADVKTDENGNVTATGTITGKQRTVINYTNTYKADPGKLIGSANLKVKKEFQLADDTSAWNMKNLKDSQFTFLLTAKDNAPLPEDAAQVTVTSEKNIEKAFGDITFAEPGTYEYEITEQDPGKNGKQGVSYSKATYKVTVTVTDENGKLNAVAEMKKTRDDNGAALAAATVAADMPATFKNVYDSSTDVDGGTKATISAKKTLNGRTLKAKEFTFELATHPTKGNGTVLQTKENNANGTIPFDELSYKTSTNVVGDGEILSQAVQDGYADKFTNNDGETVYTLHYRVSEKKGNLEGVSHTVTTFDFDVIVTDNGDGTLKAETQYPQEKNEFEFINTYSTEKDSIPMDIKGSKDLNHAEGLTPPNIAGMFTFTLEAVTQGAPMPPDNTTVTNDKAGNVDFGNITFNLDLLEGEPPAPDGSRTKTFEYKVTESGSVAGVTNDTETTKTFSITLTDDGKGHLTATCDSEEDPMFTFTNTYSVEELQSSITDQIKIDKDLTGRDLRDGEFKFELLEDGEVIATGSNDASGNVTFNKIKYAEPGQHTYTVREVNNDLEGVTYDDQAYTVSTTISDNGDGTMNAEHQAYALIDGKELAPVDEITFTNKYEAKGTTASIGAVKRLTGKDLKDGQFTFQLKDKDGKVIDEAKNDKAGAISFKALEFDKAGTYKYTISEVNDKQKEIKYDTSEKTVTITVKDSGDGYLQAQVESEKQLIFTNTFEAAGGSGTKTGDNMNLVLPIMMMLTAAAIGSVLLIRRKYHR